MFVDHLAFLTADLNRQSEALPDFCQKQPIESFPAEGTQEQYIELSKGPKLLLLQPIAAGPYTRALQKRGPGLHHLGVQTSSLNSLIPSLNQQGLRLLPVSIQTIKQGCIWLCRHDLPFLIEVFENESPTEFQVDPCDQVELALPSSLQAADLTHASQPLFSNLQLTQSDTNCLKLIINQQIISLPLI